MIIKLVFLSWVSTILVVADIQSHPMKDDILSIVESLKKDIDHHLQLKADAEQLRNLNLVPDDEYVLSSKPLTNNTVMHNEISVDREFEKTDEYSSDYSEVRYGSVKGVPGVQFPNYTDIPRTSFTCSNKVKLPGFYADMDTGCQVFHVCWPDRRESFLCPMGTIFNQPISACDYWYNSNCSLSASYYRTNSRLKPKSSKSVEASMVDIPVQKTDSLTGKNPATSVMFFVSEFMPVKAKLVLYPKTENQHQKIVASVSIGQTNDKLKTKFRNKTLMSKHSRVPRSLEYERSSEESKMAELKTKIKIYRYWEALDNAIIGIKNDKSSTHLYQYVKPIPKILKYWFLRDTSPTKVDVEPGSELYEYDISVQLKAKWMTLVYRIFIEYMAGLWHSAISVKENETSHEDDELESLKPAPLTQLNSRFIVKPIKKESLLSKTRVKRAAAKSAPEKLLQGDLKDFPPEIQILLRSLFESKQK